ncbi:solute carrier family 25 member 44-like protein [Dinothrombium tinctorium]|uniref:Solute carrier family 25 member 44-like protein n=1 Tax=Dinothrombium tinctorium TaxID=1965070 RepID=A0A443QSQ3_9ACAR|nr:solute carrier family 25 member 44-like protein [Dinothrombium tinctorium]RWS06064.1 solute carrier family 25 member 44-like protein [Dinothrombium tinctorium]RWS10912.1 solute carrier family 25 member 44-like protein [Dinothrombium tinctorium]
MDDKTITTIEWSMMDKHRFLALSTVNSLTLRSILYPLTVIKTRLQVQKHNSVYKGTFDAFVKIIEREGFRGLYKGFMINTMQVVSGIGYIITYEKIRDILTKYGNIKDSRIKGLIGGGIGSIVSQTIITPFDVVSQHIMVDSGSKKNASLNRFSSLTLNKNELARYGFAVTVIRELYRKDGLKGFYRGYFASLSTFVPSSALWWMFYSMYSEFLINLVPIWTSHMLVHCTAGTIGGITVAIITNPLDVIRANIQVHRLNSYSRAVNKLWLEEGIGVFYKGLSARITQSSISSAIVVMGYETMKRLSLGEEYRDKIRW